MTFASATTFGHVQIAFTHALSARILTNRPQPSMQSRPNMFHFSNPSAIRRPRLSERPGSQGSITTAGRGLAIIEPASHGSEAREDLGFRYRSSMPPTERLGRPHGVQQEGLVGEHPLRCEQTVFAELRGSDSAMGITKKVRCTCTRIRPRLIHGRKDFGIRELSNCCGT